MAIPDKRYKAKNPIRVKCVINTLPDSAYLFKYDNLELAIKKLFTLLKQKGK